jgi:hypothetical protein
MPILRVMRRFIWPALAAGGVAIVIGLFVFEPWALWIDKTVNEPIPTAVAAESEQPSPSAPVEPEETESTESADPDKAETSQPAAPKVLAEGDLISHEHETSGRVLILELPDKSRILRLEDLDTSNGPDIEVWITDAPVIEGSDGWHVFDDGEYVDLGDLKGNHGNQNYSLPSTVDISELSSVSLWCDRFNVSFGAADLT